VIGAKAAGVINLKIMKSGVLEACRIATIARANGIELMFGGMVENASSDGLFTRACPGIGRGEAFGSRHAIAVVPRTRLKVGTAMTVPE